MTGRWAAGLAGAGGCLLLASLVLVPAALAAPDARPDARPGATVTTKPPTGSGKTVTAKVTITAKPPKQAPVTHAPSCRPQQAGSPSSEIKVEPWPQRQLGFTDVWPLTRGAGVTVAVVDSGVDVSHRQLQGRVQALDVTRTTTKDCLGHGTMAAGIIGAQDLRAQHIPFLGVAPAARILSVKMAVADAGNNPSFMANAIREAAKRGAKVINVSVKTPDTKLLRSAVTYAQSKDALIVASAGNVDNTDSSQTPAYPANYPGVVSVGAIGSDGQLWEHSNIQTRVSVVAPGKDVVSTWADGLYHADNGTSFSAPFVAGVAALIRSYHPNLTYQQVAHRIQVTADGGTVTGTGSGLINPLQAVTAVLPEENGGPLAPIRPHAVAIARPARTDVFTRTLALSLAGGALVIAGALALGGVIVPAGRRRNWRSGRRTT